MRWTPTDAPVEGDALPDTRFYNDMRRGHWMRQGHALVAHLEFDGAIGWTVRECC